MVCSYLKRLASLAVICEVKCLLHANISTMVTSCLPGGLEVTPHHLLHHKVYTLYLESNTPFFLQKKTIKPFPLSHISFLSVPNYPFISLAWQRSSPTALWLDFIVLQRYHISLSALCFMVYPQFCKLNMSGYAQENQSLTRLIFQCQLYRYFSI